MAIYWWTPSVVFPQGSFLALDTETTVVDLTREVPAMVVGGISDGQNVYLLKPEDVINFRAYAVAYKYTLFMHNAAFDLAVLEKVTQDDLPKAAKEAGTSWYDLVDSSQVVDTMLLFQLLEIATKGKHIQSSLKYVVETVFGKQVEKLALDKDGDVIRMSFSKWIGRLEQMTQDYVDYVADDILLTYQVGMHLLTTIAGFVQERGRKQDTFGNLTMSEITDAWGKYGPLTHHIQLKGAIVLHQITLNGMYVNSAAVERFIAEVHKEVEQIGARLATEYGFFKGPGSSGVLQGFFTQVDQIIVAERRKQGLPVTEVSQGVYTFLPRTATGKFQTGAEVIGEYELHSYSDFFELYLKHQTLEKELNSFLKKLYGGYGMFGKQDITVHPSFTPILSTGRVSSWGEINSQNIPKVKGMRECFVAREGHCFINVDYSGIEMVTLCDAVRNQFHVDSHVMQEAINSGRDLHKETAAFLVGHDDVTKEERQKAKAANFGLPGGMGGRRLATYMRGYGVRITEEEGQAIADGWKTKYPEMRYFINELEPPAQAILAQAVYSETGWCAYNEAPTTEEGWRICGYMTVKLCTEQTPVSSSGNPYDINMVMGGRTCVQSWAIKNGIADLLPAGFPRYPISKSNMETLLGRLGWKYTATATGRYRRTSRFTEKRNTIFQGLAADGMKLASYLIYRAGYKIVNIVHDEILVEVPDNRESYTEAYNEICNFMRQGMHEVVRNTRVEVEGAITRCWSKDAKLLMDDDYNYLIWEYNNATVS